MEDLNKLFFDILDNYDIEKEENSNICLITKEPLEENYIKLKCGHSFNYIPLYNEINRQKRLNNQSMDDRRLLINQIKCQYCRSIHNYIIPYINIPSIVPLYGVNYPKKYVLYGNTCKHIFKSGKRKNTVCGKDCLKDYCNLHEKCKSNQKDCGCIYVFKKGVSKGERCNKKISENELCKKHLKIKNNISI